MRAMGRRRGVGDAAVLWRRARARTPLSLFLTVEVDLSRVVQLALQDGAALDRQRQAGRVHLQLNFLATRLRRHRHTDQHVVNRLLPADLDVVGLRV